jgi:hypothetical protein
MGGRAVAAARSFRPGGRFRPPDRLAAMLNETWKDQYERMKRSFALFKQVDEPTLLPQDVIPGRDVLHHFCCDAFHLRDWIAATIGTDASHTKQTSFSASSTTVRNAKSSAYNSAAKSSGAQRDNEYGVVYW